VVEGFQYEISRPAAGHSPGHHKSPHAGGGLEFRGHTPLLGAPDARRIDLLASLKDPFEQWMVRTYRQRSSIALYVLSDLSASMGARSVPRKLDSVADFIESAAYSAYRTGDAFGFIGADECLREDFFLPATRTPAAGAALSAKVRAFAPQGTSARGLLQAVSWLPPRRCLVFLVSDFHLPLPLLRSTLDSLARHQVIPVMLWDRVEFSPPARYGISVLRDAETGRQRTLLLRPALRRSLAIAFRQRYESLSEIFAHRGMRPLLLTEGFRAEQVTRYFADTRPVALPLE
jgi:hypothetical protein